MPNSEMPHSRKGNSLSVLTCHRLIESIEADFTTTAADATCLHGRDISEALPPRHHSLSELRTILLDESTEPELLDAIWRQVIKLTHGDRRWELSALWLMLPALRSIRRRLTMARPADRQDLESEIILAFLKNLREADPTGVHLSKTLWWKVFAHARSVRMWLWRESPSEFADILAEQQRRDEEPSTASDVPGPMVADSTRREGVLLGTLAQRLGLLKPRCSWEQPGDDGSPTRRLQDVM